MYIYIKLSPKWKTFQEQQVFYFRFYILCENFSKIGRIIKKIPKFSDDPLNVKIIKIYKSVLRKHPAEQTVIYKRYVYAPRFAFFHPFIETH